MLISNGTWETLAIREMKNFKSRNSENVIVWLDDTIRGILQSTDNTEPPCIYRAQSTWGNSLTRKLHT